MVEKQNWESQVKQEQNETALRQKEEAQGLEIHQEELQIFDKGRSEFDRNKKSRKVYRNK